ncbi:MAG: ABC transporter ATP-binding protein [Erysipelotrichaceae bacterium]
MLKINDVSVNYGVIKAVRNINLEVKEKEIVTLIGANGAGKSSLLKAICNLIDYQGEIEYNNIVISKQTTKDIILSGITMVPEGRDVFPLMSVYDNLILGAFLRKDKDQIKKDIKKMYERFPILEQRKDQLAQNLSGGEQQMLAMARALMSRPKVLLLDEPSMGLSPLLVKEIFRIIREINDQGTTIILVEQNAKMALEIANRAYVFENGVITVEGDAKELLKSDTIRKAYLGG